MDPVEVREERVVTGTAPGVVQAAPVAPAATAVEPALGAVPVAAPVAAAPVAAVAPVAAATVPAGTGVYTSRTGVYPVGYRAIQVVWLVIGILNIILALDFVFRAVSATDTGFYHYIYRIGSALASPFQGIFGTAVDNGQYTLRWADLVAIAVYSIVGWILAKIIRIGSTPRTGVSAV